MTKGRLEMLIGAKDAETALEEKWYVTKPGTGSQVLIFYTEESRTAVKEKKVSKEVKGGATKPGNGQETALRCWCTTRKNLALLSRKEDGPAKLSALLASTTLAISG